MQICVNTNLLTLPIPFENLASKSKHFGFIWNFRIAIILGAKAQHDEALTIDLMDIDIGLQTSNIFDQIYWSYRIINNQAYHR